MTSPLQRKRKSPQGRKADPNIAPGSRRARGRLVDPEIVRPTRADVLVAALAADGHEPGDRLAAFVAGEDIDRPEWALSALASEYQAWEAHVGRRSAIVRALDPFTPDEIAEIRAGRGEKHAPWSPLQASRR